MTIEEIYAERVRDGIELLDNVMPKWREGIDVDELDMVVCERCILGQLYNRFYAGVDILELNGIAWRYGFDLPPYERMTPQERNAVDCGNSISFWQILNNLWIENV